MHPGAVQYILRRMAEPQRSLWESIKDYFDTDLHPGPLAFVRVLMGFAVVGIVVAAAIGSGWPWAPAENSMIGDSWTGIRILFGVFILAEIFYAIRRSSKRS